LAFASAVIIYGGCMAGFFFSSPNSVAILLLATRTFSGVCAIVLAHFLRRQEPLYPVNVGTIVITVLVALLSNKNWETRSYQYHIQLQSGTAFVTRNLLVTKGPEHTITLPNGTTSPSGPTTSTYYPTTSDMF
jgi:hypothetical protein